MAIVSTEFTAGLYTQFSVVFETSFFAAESIADYPRYTDTLESQTLQNSYNFLDVPPAMRPWVGSRVMQDMPAFAYTLVNQIYEASIDVRRTALEDDMYGAIQQRVSQLGLEASRFLGLQASLALANGNARVCYDGQNFFATTHQQGASGVQSNLITGTGNDTIAHLRADFLTARVAMRRYLDGAGRPMNLQPDLLVTPPEVQDLWEQLINTNLIAFAVGTAAAAPSNVLRGAVDIMVDSNLTDATSWYLLCTTQAMKPVMYQHRAGPEFDALDNPGVHDTVFLNDRLVYGVRARFAFGYSLWPLAVKVVG